MKSAPDALRAALDGNGRITLPRRLREALGVATGDRVRFIEVAPGRFEVVAATRSVTELKGMFGNARTRVAIDDMNPVIATRTRGQSSFRAN